MRLEKRKIDELIPAIYNPRKDLTINDAEYKKIKRSIETFGYVDPIIVNERTGVIVGGHQRLKVLKDLGYEEIEVSVVNLDEKQEKALNVALNKISGEWDFELLKDLLEELDDGSFDVELTGFDMDEIEGLMTQYFDDDDVDVEVTEDDFDLDESMPENPITKLGDVWKLGGHRLMCGDSTDIEHMKRLMGKEKADMLLTDPPYNVNYEGKTAEALKIENDSMGDAEFRAFLKDAFSVADDVMREGAVFYIWHADSEGYNFRGACKDVGWQVRQCLIWNKNSMVMGRQDYHWKHEPCLYGWKDGAAHLWCSDRKQTTVLDFDRPTKNIEHPTMKPVKLFDYQIRNNTKPNDIVLDPFAGSGTTLIACEQNGRVARLMELDPKYCDVIIKRWETYTGEKAVLLNEESNNN
jgi:DNA modification methylase